MNFGLPCFGNDVRGVEALMRKEDDGILLSLEIPPEDSAREIRVALRDSVAYVRLLGEVYTFGGFALDWNIAGIRVARILGRVAGSGG
jgi:hypothetical protein